jgi:dTDP-4-dehydrorhamnose reductase
MLGSEVAAQLTAAGMPWVGSGREVDVTDAAALERFVAALPSAPTTIINGSAYTAVDKAEDEP